MSERRVVTKNCLAGGTFAITPRRDDRSLLDFGNTSPPDTVRPVSARIQRPPLPEIRRDRRALPSRCIRHDRNSDAFAEGFTQGFPVYLRPAMPARTVIQLFFRL